jgi:hypothetical protein
MVLSLIEGFYGITMLDVDYENPHFQLEYLPNCCQSRVAFFFATIAHKQGPVLNNYLVCVYCV